MPKSIDRFYYKQNRLKQLRAFCYAAQTGSISRAAEHMFLSQPSASLLIRALEKEMNAVLFERNGPKIGLTEQGRILYDIALPIVSSMETLPALFSQRCNHDISGELAVAAEESTIVYILQDIAEQFVRRHPQVRLTLTTAFAGAELALVLSSQADLGIGLIDDLPPDIDSRGVLSCRSVVLTPPGHPLTELGDGIPLQAVVRYPLIVPTSRTTPGRIVLEAFRGGGLALRPVLEVSGWQAIQHCVGLGLGVAVVPSVCPLVDGQLTRIPLDSVAPKWTYGVIRRRGRHLSPGARAFVDLLAPGFP